MTLPDERANAIQQARRFLLQLMDPRETPRIPRAVRMEARARLKHFPTDLDLERLADAAPEVVSLPYKLSAPKTIHEHDFTKAGARAFLHATGMHRKDGKLKARFR
jgi:hypothetical protein